VKINSKHLPALLATLAAPVLATVLSQALPVSAQSLSTVTLWNNSTAVSPTFNMANLVTYVQQEPTPNGAVYHQVVDVYYDAAGKKVKTTSATHAVDPANCHPGRRQQDRDLLVEDDGKGGPVRFVDARLSNEPATGQPAVTAETKIRAMLASKAATTPAPLQTPASPTELAQWALK